MMVTDKISKLQKKIDKVSRLQKKIDNLKRIKIIAKEKVVFKAYHISKLDREILLNFNKISSTKLAKKLRCNRSYIYATIEKFKDILTRSEVI